MVFGCCLSHVPLFIRSFWSGLWVLVNINGEAEDFGYGNPNHNEEKLKKVFTDQKTMLSVEGSHTNSEFYKYVGFGCCPSHVPFFVHQVILVWSVGFRQY